MKKLTDICDIQYGYAFDSKCFTEDSAYPPLVRIRDVKRGYSETYYSGEYLEEYVLSAGDLLVGMDGEFNIARWKCTGALLNQRVCKLVAKIGTNEEYLRFAMSKALKKIEQRTAFVTVKHLSAKELNKLELDVPELSNQDRIADILNRLENVIEKRREELDKLDELIKARFVELFGNLDINDKGWNECSLGEACNKVIRYPTFYGMDYLETGTRVIRIGNILEDGHMELADENYVFVYDGVNEDFPETVMELNDIVMAVRGDGSAAKRIGIIREEELIDSNISPNLIRIKAGKELEPLFLFYYLTGDVGQRRLDAYVNKTAKKNIAAKDIVKVIVPIPPLLVQKQFADFVHQVDKSKVAVQKALDETKLLFDSLMQQYFG